MKHFARLLLVAPLLLGAGCPPSDRPRPDGPPPAGLALQVDGADPRVGGALDLKVTLTGTGGEQPLMGALLADQASLTEWHAEPAEAVSFDPASQRVTLVRPGAVTIWATWVDDGGRRLESNRVELSVTQ